MCVCDTRTRQIFLVGCVRALFIHLIVRAINSLFILTHYISLGLFRGWGVLGLIFAGCVPLASQRPYLIIVYSVVSYRPHLSHFRANICNFGDPGV